MNLVYHSHKSHVTGEAGLWCSIPAIIMLEENQKYLNVYLVTKFSVLNLKTTSLRVAN